MRWLDDWLSEDRKECAFRHVAEQAASGENFAGELRVYHREASRCNRRFYAFFALLLGGASLVGTGIGKAIAYVVGSHQEHVATAAPVRRGASSTAKLAPSKPVPPQEPVDPGPAPLWENGAGVLQLYTVNDRRSADVEAAQLRTLFGMRQGRQWAVRVVVVPWWGNGFTVVVNGTTPASANAMCAWLREFGRPEMPPPAPNRAQGRSMCQQHPGPWPQQNSPRGEE